MLQNDPACPSARRTLILVNAREYRGIIKRGTREVGMSRRQVERLFPPTWAPRLALLFLNFVAGQNAGANLGFDHPNIAGLWLCIQLTFQYLFQDFFGESPSVARKKKQMPRWMRKLTRLLMKRTPKGARQGASLRADFDSQNHTRLQLRLVCTATVCTSKPWAFAI